MQNQQNLSPKRAKKQENLKSKGRGEKRREEKRFLRMLGGQFIDQEEGNKKNKIK